jgi:hypothetical protein
MGRQQLFNRGVPTEPDVTALINQFGVPVEGTPITYREIASVLQVSITAHRFRTVTAAWRKSLNATHGIILIAGNGQFAVRDPGARVALGKTKTKSGVRCFTAALDIIQGTDQGRLSERERADSDKVQRIASLSQAAALSAARQKPTPALRAVNAKTAVNE